MRSRHGHIGTLAALVLAFGCGGGGNDDRGDVLASAGDPASAPAGGGEPEDRAGGGVGGDPADGGRQDASEEQPTGVDPEGTIVPSSGCMQGLPSAPGPHLAKVAALGGGQWTDLGSPAADPKWGKARGRSWTPRMPFVPALGGAFLYGEGVHGYVKPDGHYMDDLWFYDVHAHAWRTCYPGAHAATLKLTIGADGFEIDAAGNPIPVAQQVHGYELNTYDTQDHQFLSMPAPGAYWDKALPQRLDWLVAPPKTASPWMFKVDSGLWARKRTTTAGPTSKFGDILFYIPTLKKAFFHSFSTNNNYLYDPAANDWSPITVTGPKPPFGIEATACFDPKRNRLYFGGGNYPVADSAANALWIYDVATNAFVNPKPANAQTSWFPANNAVTVCDTVHDRVLVILHSAAEKSGVYAYDPNTNAWEARQPVPSALYDHKYQTAKNGFFDPSLDAVFIHEASDSADNGKIWAYRYRK